MFPSVIPLSGTDCSRVTHPSAARISTEVNIPARLACVKHAASVRPEPGSNSDVQSFSSTHPLLQQLAKATASAPRQGVLLIRNLTVLFLVFYLRLCIVFKFRRRRLRCFARDNVDYYSSFVPLCQHFFSLFLRKI